MFPLKKTAQIIVSVAAIMSTAVAAEGCVNPQQNLPDVRPAPAQQQAPASPSAPALKKDKNDAKPHLSPGRNLRKLMTTVRKSL